jgi:DNA polymerase-3 subunit beta
VKFDINREDFLTALTAAAKLAKEKSPMPALADVLLVFDGANVEVRSTNLEIHFQAQVPATGEAGACSVDAKRMLAFTKGTTADTLSAVLSDKGRLNVRCGSSRVSIAVHPADEYPDLPQIDGLESDEVDASALAEALKSTAYAAGEDSERMMFAGVRASDFGVYVATDGRRLASVEGPVVPENAIGTWPSSFVKVLLPTLSGFPGDATVAAGEGWVGVEVGGFFFLARMVDTKFTDWRKIVPERDVTVGIVVSTEALVAAAKRLLAAGDGVGVLQYAEQSDHLLFTTRGSMADGEERVGAEPGHRAVEPTGVDLKSLLEMLKAKGGDEIELSFLDPLSPVSVFDEDDVHLLMPMHIEAG